MNIGKQPEVMYNSDYEGLGNLRFSVGLDFNFDYKKANKKSNKPEGQKPKYLKRNRLND